MQKQQKPMTYRIKMSKTATLNLINIENEKKIKSQYSLDQDIYNDKVCHSSVPLNISSNY